MYLYNLLFLLIFINFISIFIIFFLKDNHIIKNFSLFVSLFIYLISLFVWIFFDKNTPNFQFFYKIFWFDFFNINLSIGIDGISLFFIILTTFLIPICILISFNSIKKNIKEYFILFLFLEFFLLLIFSTLDLFFFYIFFESILIPMFLIIGIWGSRERKVRASYLFFIYTLAGSLLMLLSIISIHITKGSTDYMYLLNVNFDPFIQKIYWLTFFFSFAVKVPMLPFHIWLPEAHVEAPTAGSVILAGILLKLGSYGFLRFSMPLFPIATIYFTPLIYTLSTIAIIFTSLTAIRQTDMKRVIAYASVAHMNLILLGMFSYNIQGIEGSILQMLSHGIVSSALFVSIGVLYDQYHSRLINYYGGLVHKMPLFSIFFLIYILSNIALPGTSSFIGEFLIFLGIYQNNTIITLLSLPSMVLGGIYSLWLYNRIVFGNISNIFLKTIKDLTILQLIVNIFLTIPIFLIGIYPNIFLQYMHVSVLNLIYNFI